MPPHCANDMTNWHWAGLAPESRFPARHMAVSRVSRMTGRRAEG